MGSLYPPPPPGWDNRALQVPAPAAGIEGQRLSSWAQERGYELNAKPDLQWYHGWSPFVFLNAPERLGREVSARMGEAQLWIVEGFSHVEGHEISQIVAFVLSPRLAYRAAVRSRMQKEAVEELRESLSPRKTPRALGRWRWREREQFLRRTYGRGVRGVIGDAIFEAHCEIQSPSREEGLAALPVALRHWLIQTQWRGILELRPGGMIVTSYGPPLFDPAALDATVHHVSNIYHAAIRAAAPPGPPSSGPLSVPR